MSDFGAVLIRRLTAAAERNQTILDDNQAILDNNQAAAHKLDIVIPELEKDEKGNQIALAAMREVYGLLEADMEGRQTTIEELKKTKGLLKKSADLLKKSAALLKSAGFDFANIQTFSNDEIWLGDHLDTIKRFINIVNLQKLEVALDEEENDRFEDFAHAVKRSGDRRQKAAETAALAGTPDANAAAVALAAIEAMKVAISHEEPPPSTLRQAQEEPTLRTGPDKAEPE